MPPEQILAALMFAGMIAFLFFGFPVAFSLTFTGLFFGLLGVSLGYLRANFFDILPLRIWGTMTNFTLLAVPLFVFMGVALEKSGLAEELLETMALLFGKLKGGIAISVVVVGAILAASTGIVGASVITMGLISLPTMLRRGYDKQLICGTICASGTLGQIIPPSVILILLGDIMGVSVGDLYIGAVIPGLVLVALYIVYLLILSHVKPHLAPPIPAQELAAFRGDAVKRVVIALIPAFVLIVGVLGSIFAGIASPTEAASVGAAGRAHPHDAQGPVLDGDAPLGHADDDADHEPGVHHPGGRQLLRAGLPRAQRRPSDPGFPQGPALRRLRGPGRRHVRDLPAGLLHRLLRDLLHPRADPDAGPGDALRLRSGLARRGDRREPPDVLPDTALRVRALLPPGRGADRRSRRRISTAGSCRSSRSSSSVSRSSSPSPTSPAGSSALCAERAV